MFSSTQMDLQGLSVIGYYTVERHIFAHSYFRANRTSSVFAHFYFRGSGGDPFSREINKYNERRHEMQRIHSYATLSAQLVTSIKFECSLS